MGKISSEKRHMSDERCFFTIPKNDQTEQHVSAKEFARAGMTTTSKFIEIREYWFKDGPLEEPLATKKGTMIHRPMAFKMCVAILNELVDGGDAFEPETLEDLRSVVYRLEGKVADG